MTALDDALLPSIAYLALATVHAVNTTKSDRVHVYGVVMECSLYAMQKGHSQDMHFCV